MCLTASWQGSDPRRKLCQGGWATDPRAWLERAAQVAARGLLGSSLYEGTLLQQCKRCSSPTPPHLPITALLPPGLCCYKPVCATAPRSCTMAISLGRADQEVVIERLMSRWACAGGTCEALPAAVRGIRPGSRRQAAHTRGWCPLGFGARSQPAEGPQAEPVCLHALACATSGRKYSPPAWPVGLPSPLACAPRQPSPAPRPRLPTSAGGPPALTRPAPAPQTFVTCSTARWTLSARPISPSWRLHSGVRHTQGGQAGS